MIPFYVTYSPTSCVLSSFLLSSYRLSVPTSSFLSYSRAKVFLLSTFSCLIHYSFLCYLQFHTIRPLVIISPFLKGTFNAYFLLPFLSDSGEKMFLLSSFSCLKLRFLSILPTVLHHPSFYISPFQILTFSVYLRLPFLSDSRAKTFLLSTFSCLQ